MPLYTMPDGNDYEFESDSEATRARAAWNAQFGKVNKEKPTSAAVQATEEGRSINPSIQGAITALQGPAMGFLDELAGIGSAITGGIANLTPWGDDKTMYENYIRGRNKIRGSTSKYTEDYPGTALTSQIAASAPMMVAGGATQAASKTPGLFSKIISGGATGARYGAVSGLGSSEADTAAGDIENMGTGALFGGVLGGALPVVASGVGKTGGWLYDRATRGYDIDAGKILRDAAGGELANTKAILSKANPNQTTGQALAMAGGGNRDELLALARVAQQMGDPNSIRKLAEFQSGRNQALIQSVSGGASSEASIAAQRAAHTSLEKTLDPMRVRGAEAANRNTRILEMLRQKSTDYGNQASQRVEDVRRFTAAGQRAADRANNTAPINWMPRVAGKYTYMGDLANRAEQVATSSAQASLKAGASANVANNLEQGISAKGISTLSARPLLNEIDTMTSKVGDRANPVLTKTLEGFKAHALKFVDENGNIDAYDLHQLRKNANDMIDTLFPGADSALKQRAGAVLTKLKPTIDSGLKAAGGKELVDYFDAYSKGMNEINRMKMGDMIRGMKPDDIIALVKGNSPDTVEKVFGAGNFSFQNQMGEAAKPISTVAKRLEGEALLASRGDAPAAQNSIKKILERDMLGFRLPAYLSKSVATANFGLSRIERSLNEGTRNALFSALQSPSETVRIANTLPVLERVKFFNALRDPRVSQLMSAQSGMLTGRVIGVQSGNGVQQ